jgi:iron complex transport system ATP-binding protein
MLEVENLTVRAGGVTIVEDVCLSLEPGDWLTLVGPNGAGKSTIINAISQCVPYTGRIKFEGRDIRRFKPAQLARRLGVLAQGNAVGYAFTAEEIVRLGRYAYNASLFSSGSDEDDEFVERALELTGMAAQRGQSALTLSGGELQRTFLAQVFAQNPNVLLLDEPTNHLDLMYQKQIFEMIEGWLREPQRAVLSVIHDLSLARAYGTKAILLDRGRIKSAGDMRYVFAPDNLNGVYAMNVYEWMRAVSNQWRE